MEIEILKEDNMLMIIPKGRLDTSAATEFDSKVASAGEKIDTDVEIDCHELEYISSSGLRSFISILKNARENDKKVTVNGLTPQLKSIFDMTGFSKLFNIK